MIRTITNSAAPIINNVFMSEVFISLTIHLDASQNIHPQYITIKAKMNTTNRMNRMGGLLAGEWVETSPVFS
jgi:hypothetical protein